MAKFENHLKNSDLTWSDLSAEVNAKIDSYENVYEAYSNAHAADDTKLVNKYDKQLEKLDAEILSMIKKQESASKSVEKKETSPLAEAQPEVKETPKVEAKEEVKEEVKEEDTQDNTGISFWWD